jgi:glyoxylase-like metal-dependent hydrolase (beta-lactamase superfamily II)
MKEIREISMSKNIISATNLVLYSVLIAGGAFAQDESPIEINWLSDRIAVATGGRHNTNNVLIKTDRGLVLVDTGVSPEYARRLREALKRETGQDEYFAVINTHHHWDHVQGNQVFGDAAIIGHARCREAMTEIYSGMEKVSREKSGNKVNLSAHPDIPPPPRHGVLAPSGAAPDSSGEESRVMSGNLLSGGDFIPTPPDILFDDRLILELNDLEIELIAYGRAHTDNDVIVVIPEEKTVVVGDLFFRNMLPTFVEVENPDFDRWIEVWNRISFRRSFTHVVPGHGELIRWEEMQEKLEYIESLCAGIEWAVREDKASLDEVKARFALKERYPHLADSDIKDNEGVGIHSRNVEVIYKRVKADIR